MALQATYDIVAQARITVAGGVPSIVQQNGAFASVGDTGAGVYTLNRDTDVGSGWAAADIIVSLTVELATYAGITYTITDEDTIVVRTWDAAGEPLDNVPFSVEIRKYRR